MPVIKAGAFDLDYWEAGRGPALVLVHSSASGNRQWRRLAEDLQDRYRLIAVNLFGYGATAPWPGDRKQALADQAALVMAAASLAPEPVTLIGHSLGAAVSLEAALRLRDRIGMVIVFEPIPFYLLETHGPAICSRRMDRLMSLPKSTVSVPVAASLPRGTTGTVSVPCSSTTGRGRGPGPRFRPSAGPGSSPCCRTSSRNGTRS